MHVTLTSPTIGLTAAYPCTTPTGPSDARWRRYRQGVKSAPVHARSRILNPDRKLRSRTIRYPQQRPAVPAATRISLDDVVSMAEHARELTSQQSRRIVMEEAHRALRHEGVLDRSRPHSVVGPGLQSLTSPMPSPSRAGQMDHIPSLLPLPSDRTFIPSPDQNHDRHVTTTPAENFRLEEDNSHHPVARQCCEIMGPSLCRSCRRLESRAQNRKSAELECPRMRSAGGRGRQTFSLTQVIKRSYPRLSDAETQDKLARGEIARLSFPWSSRSRPYEEDDDSCNLSSGRSSVLDRELVSYNDENEEEDKDILHVDPGTYRATTPSSTPNSVTVNCGREGKASNTDDQTENKTSGISGTRQHLTKASLSTKNAFYFLAKLTMKLQGSTTTPLFISDLRGMQGKILSGTVDRKAYMTLRPEAAGQRPNQQGPPSRLKSAVSTASTSSGKSGLSKFGSQLSREFMPAFVSPRKVKLIEEPKYKVYFEPPLLTKRRQIPNPSFFAGSNDEYSLPERLPDVIEFADSQRIAAMEKQIRSGSALSFVSSMSDEQQQQQQTPVGSQDKLTSLPLDKEDDSASRVGGESRPSSGKTGMGERGGFTPTATPRSMLRVSSGGPLSSRTVPEEKEEDVKRELEADEQAIKGNGENCNTSNSEAGEGDEQTLPKAETQNKLSTVEENANIPEKNVEGEGFVREEDATLWNELEQLDPKLMNISPGYSEKEHQEEVENCEDNADEERLSESETSIPQVEKSELLADLEITNKLAPEEMAIVEESNKEEANSFSPFFLTNRESEERTEPRTGGSQKSQEGPDCEHTIATEVDNVYNTGSDHSVTHRNSFEDLLNDSGDGDEAADTESKSETVDSGNEGKWWTQ